MKPLLVLLSVVVCNAATAQDVELPPVKKNYGLKKYENIQVMPNVPVFKKRNPVVPVQQPKAVVRDGVLYPLTFGNMPCVVPQAATAAVIPNLFHAPLLRENSIPNPLGRQLQLGGVGR